MPNPLHWPPTVRATGASEHTVVLYADDREHLETVARALFEGPPATWNVSQVFRRCLRLEAERITRAKAQRGPVA